MQECVSGPKVSPMETLGDGLSRSGITWSVGPWVDRPFQKLIFHFRGWSSLLRVVFPFGVDLPFQGLVIPFKGCHPFWAWSSILGLIIPFRGQSSHLGLIIPFGVGHPFQGLVILFRIDHRSSLLGLIIPFRLVIPFGIDHPFLLGLIIPFGVGYPFWDWSSLSGFNHPF